jgi:hypothetical protein
VSAARYRAATVRSREKICHDTAKFFVKQTSWCDN